MTDYLYRADGSAAGFIKGRYIYEAGGKPVGQISSSGRVHRLTGEYVGELHKEQVVDKQVPNIGKVGAITNLPDLPRRGLPGNRGERFCPFPDVFDKLL
jgi:hypothetical protein